MYTNQKNILLVEDETILAMVEMQQLQEYGYNVVHVLNGELALDFIKNATQKIDLILMDIDLGSGMDGTETAKAILKEVYIPILFLSSHTEKEVVQKTENITSYGYVVKNSSFTVLDASIKMAFKLYEADKNVQLEREHLKTILDSIGDGVIATDLKGNIIRMNPIAESLTGWTIGETNNKPFKDFFQIINADTREIHPNPVDLVLSTGNIIGFANHTLLISKSGVEYLISYSGSPIKNTKDNISGVVLTFKDITKEFEYQKKIQESGALFKSLFENGPIAKVLSSTDGRWLNVNQSTCNILGYSQDELLNKYDQEFTYQDDLDLNIDRISDLFSGKVNDFVREKRFIHKNGHVVWVWQNEFLLRTSSGEPQFLITQFIDISERKKVEEKLTFQANILTNLIDIVFSINEKFEFIYWNHAAEKTFGWKSEEVLGKPVSKILKTEFIGESREKVLEDLLKNRYFLGEVIQYHKNGTKLYLEASTSVIENNNQLYFINASRNVTERKKMEADLKFSEKRLAGIIDSAMDSIISLDSNHNIVLFNEAAEEMFGYKSKDMLGQKLDKLIPEKFRSIHDQHILEFAKTGVSKRALGNLGQVTGVRANGEEFPLEASISHIDLNGQILFTAILRDVSSGIKLEGELKKREAKYHSVFDLIPFGISITDKKLKIIEYNRSLEKLLRLHPLDIENKAYENRKYIDKFGNLMNANEFPSQIAMREQKLISDVEIGVSIDDQEIIWTSISAIPIPLENYGVAIITIDITERKKAEEHIQKLLKEKELILREVHHRIKNNMNIIFNLLNIQAKSQEDSKTKLILQDASSRVRSMNVLYDKLYQSENKIQVSLKIYFPSLINEILNIFPEGEMVKVETDIEEIVLHAKQLSPLGIILNELITNAMKYAFNGKNDKQIKISVIRKENLGIFIFEDNGVGISESISFDKPIGFGLQLIKMLVAQIYGTVRIERNNGTKFIIEFKIKQKND